MNPPELTFLSLNDFYDLYGVIPNTASSNYAYFHGIVIGKDTFTGTYRCKLTTETTVVGKLPYVFKAAYDDFLENIYLPRRTGFAKDIIPLVTLDNAELGREVTRGPDWDWGNEDNNDTGVISAISSTRVMVLWKGKAMAMSYYANDDRHDLIYVD